MTSSLTKFLGSLIVLALVVVGYGAWYAFVGAKSARAVEVQNQIDVKTQTALRISSARAALAEIADSEATVNSYFVPESGVVDFIDSLEKKGGVLGSSVNVLSVSAGTNKAHPTLVVTLTVKGTFDAVMRTVGAVEFSPYDLTVSALALSQNEKGVWNANMTLTLGSTPGTLPGTSTTSAGTSTPLVAPTPSASPFVPTTKGPQPL